MSCTIRKAASQDLPRIREIYEMARQFMRKNGNHSQWGKGDEPEALIEEVEALYGYSAGWSVTVESPAM